MHGKQHQFGPPLRAALGWDLVVADVDTDSLGTFTNDVRRIASPLDTARRKARWGMEVTGASRGLASEGSFVSHPDGFGLIVAEEIVVLLDDADGLEVVERLTTTSTNARSVELTSRVLSEDFLRSVGFPEHGLIVTGPDAAAPQVKGIRDEDLLAEAIERGLSLHPRVMVTTDLRAHMNPTRQRTLEVLAAKLAARLQARCRACAAPGWGISRVEVGLPCAWCGTGTLEVAAEVSSCARVGCSATHNAPIADEGNPAWCPRCNP